MESVKALMPGFLREISSDPELSLIFLEELWPQIVGGHVARRARPVALKAKILTCQVAADAWKAQLSEMSPMLIGAINQFWGCCLVERIQLVRHLDVHRA